MSEKTFAQALNGHVPREFAASQAYLAAAIYYDDLTMPRMAAFFYRQAIEERNHAMMIIRYLLDINEEATIPGVAAPKNGFSDLVEPVRTALEQERTVMQQISALAAIARAANCATARRPKCSRKSIVGSHASIRRSRISTV